MTRRVAVIGCGDISVVHLEALAALDDVELVAVCDTDPHRLSAAVARTGAPGFGDHVSLLDQVRPDVVHVTTPHSEHAAIAIDALDRGVHVLTEKPLAHSTAAGNRMIEAARRSTAKLAVCFQNRYNAASRRMREIIDSGELGAVRSAAATVMWHRTAEYYRDRPWRGTWEGSGGGLLMNQAIHTLDLLQWLVGEVEHVEGSVSAHALADTIEVEDTAEMVLTHRGGVRSVFSATLANAVNAPVTIDIVLERGTLSLGAVLTITHDSGEVEVVREPLTASGDRAYWGASHLALIRDFHRSLETPEPFWIDAVEAMRTLAVIQELYDQNLPARDAADAHHERSISS
jgi:UDP-N-acetyl-2-amino-2-deoxyglucuronate dehydrogenase